MTRRIFALLDGCRGVRLRPRCRRRKVISAIRWDRTGRRSFGRTSSPISKSCAKASDRIRVDELGKSVEGRPFIAATISSAETLRNLDRYRKIQARLADPRGL